ncbi:hypothetical protein EBR43_14020, partial [bacterium]|nr:hypothetical protein [bacterium]
MTKKTTVSIFGGGFVGGTTYKVLKQLEERQWDSWQIHLYDINPQIATTTKQQAIEEADIAFVAVPTPTDFSRKICDTPGVMNGFEIYAPDNSAYATFWYLNQIAKVN